MGEQKYRLSELNFVPDPRQDYKYLMFNCSFNNTYKTKQATFYNDALEGDNSLKAIIVLLAWVIKYELGSGVHLKVEFVRDSNMFVTITYISKKTKKIRKKYINKTDLPTYIVQALTIISDSLSDYYNNSYVF